MVEISTSDMAANFLTKPLTNVQIREANDRVQLVDVRIMQRTA